MTTFDEREAAFENKFAHDADVQFQVLVRRDRLVGLWAAEKLGLTGEAADAYARSVIVADQVHPGDGDIIAKLVVDLSAKGLGEPDIRAALLAQGEIARRQIME